MQEDLMKSNYEQHLEDRKRRTMILNGAVLNSAYANTLLKIVFLDETSGISQFCDAITNGWPALIDLGATYGTAFIDSARSQVGFARGEGPNLVTVSMVSRMSSMLQWMDQDRIHPTIRASIQQGALDFFRQIAFVRFPANDAGRCLGEHCVNNAGEIQVTCRPEDDPVLVYLEDAHNLTYYEVRSSNITGNPEEPFAPGAVDYACSIAAPVVAVRSWAALEAQIIDQVLHKHGLNKLMRRQCVGSFPIFHLPAWDGNPDSPAVVEIVRSGNTAPETLLQLGRGCFPGATIRHMEEKSTNFRTPYLSAFSDPASIQADLMRAQNECRPVF
jgi:hypothetical protein